MNIQRKNSAHHFRMQSEREQTLALGCIDRKFFFQLRMWSQPHKKKKKKKKTSWSCVCCANNYLGLLQFWPQSVWFSNVFACNVSKHFLGKNMTEIIVTTFYLVWRLSKKQQHK